MSYYDLYYGRKKKQQGKKLGRLAEEDYIHLTMIIGEDLKEEVTDI